MTIPDIINIILQEHAYWEHLRVESFDFTEKNRLVVGEVTCERILHKIKQAGYEIYPNE